MSFSAPSEPRANRPLKKSQSINFCHSAKEGIQSFQPLPDSRLRGCRKIGAHGVKTNIASEARQSRRHMMQTIRGHGDCFVAYAPRNMRQDT